MYDDYRLVPRSGNEWHLHEEEGQSYMGNDRVAKSCLILHIGSNHRLLG